MLVVVIAIVVVVTILLGAGAFFLMRKRETTYQIGETTFACFPVNNETKTKCSNINDGSIGGERVYSQIVKFAKPFKTTPSVIPSMILLDSEKDTNLRYHIFVKDIKPNQFTLYLKTWSNTSIYSARIGWIAMKSE
jgi:cytochrome oxidase assembly protein ShyY1